MASRELGTFSWILDPAAQAAAPGLLGRSVLSDLDLSRAEVDALVETALWLKLQRERNQPHPYLAGKTLGMLFEHPSTRTRNAFQAGMEQLGGHATFLGANELQSKHAAVNRSSRADQAGFRIEAVVVVCHCHPRVRLVRAVLSGIITARPQE